MLDDLGVDLDVPPRAARVLAITDHLDASGTWLFAVVVAHACARAPVVVLCVEHDAREITALARKLARGARDAVSDAVARGTCAFVRATDAEDGAVRTLRDVRDAAAATKRAAGAGRVCVCVDGVDGLALRADEEDAIAVERFLDAVSREAEGEVDLVTRSHWDVGAAAAWVAESADCEIRLEPLRTGSAEDAQGMCETTHRNSAWRAKGAMRRSRAGFALTELGVKLERRR
jgi:hypothetical protein